MVKHQLVIESMDFFVYIYMVLFNISASCNGYPYIIMNISLNCLINL